MMKGNREAEKRRLAGMLEQVAFLGELRRVFRCNSYENDYYEFIADQLLNRGVIMPPCKVLDKVYAIDDESVFYETVDYIDLTVCTIEGGVYSGKHVFQTKAESALKECSE